MASSGAILAAVEMPRKLGRDWQRGISDALEHMGYSCETRRARIDTWSAEALKPLVQGGFFVDGWQLASCWLGPRRRAAIGITPRRLYFSADGRVDRRPERDVVDLKQRPRIQFEKALEELNRLLDDLRARGSKDRSLEHVSLQLGDVDLSENTKIHGSACDFPVDTNVFDVYRQDGFYDVPESFEILLCCDAGVDDIHVDDYCRRARCQFREWGARPTINKIKLDSIESRLKEISRGDNVKRKDVPTLFMLADKQTEASSRLRKVMAHFDRLGLPWRRAYAADPREWSVRNQLGSLLQAAGGHPHSLTLSGGECLPWSIGIDLSLRKKSSRVAAALISDDGRLVHVWTHDQPRAENIEPKVLRRLLAAAFERIPRDEQSSGVLVVRDGRMLESEDVNDYRRDFGCPVTLVELRKRNPPLLLGDRRRPPTRSTIAWLPGVSKGTLGFLVTFPRVENKYFDKVMKIWIHEDWDGMKMGTDHLMRILTAQTFTLGLGPQRRHLPASIYWADGIAGATDDDLRFRGQPTTALDRRT